jgi:hypothetical protein
MHRAHGVRGTPRVVEHPRAELRGVLARARPDEPQSTRPEQSLDQVAWDRGVQQTLELLGLRGDLTFELGGVVRGHRAKPTAAASRLRT